MGVKINGEEDLEDMEEIESPEEEDDDDDYSIDGYEVICRSHYVNITPDQRTA